VARFVALFRAERPDVVHVNGAFFLAPAVAARLCGVPLLWHLNDTVIPRRYAGAFGLIVRALADQIVVAARAVAEHYRVLASPFTVIYAPVDVTRIAAMVSGSGARRAGSTGRVRVGMIANWNPLKGHEYFVRAAALVTKQLACPVEFAFAGAKLTTHEDYAARVQSLIDQVGIREQIRDYGFLESVDGVLRELDVLILSSVSEACPMALLEGMAAGLPCVATDVGGVRELLLGDAQRPAGIVVAPRDPEALAAAVVELVSNDAVALELAHNAQRRAGELYSIEKCVQRHLEVYQDLARGRTHVPDPAIAARTGSPGAAVAGFRS
jgi:glycosyltransferase involved in cell wall biosynthesis